jgi:peptide/nickel transport system permease protein
VLSYVIRRLILSLGVILGVSVLVFALMHLSGDPAALLLPPEASAEDIDNFAHAMGFDRPIYVQYLAFLSRALRGDFGMSLMHARPALGVVLERVPATLQLGAAAVLIGLVIGMPAGLLSALKKDTLADSVAMVFTLLGQAVPNFWLGIVLILVLAVNLRLLPASGREDIPVCFAPVCSKSWRVTTSPWPDPRGWPRDWLSIGTRCGTPSSLW